MKFASIAALLLLIVIGCNSPEKKESVSIPGAYKMTLQSIKGPKLDTSYPSVLQQKIYTGNYVMYANFNPPDSVRSFGIGIYSTNTDTVTEKMFYNGSDSVASDKGGEYKLGIEKTAKGYKQVINWPDTASQIFSLTETYESIGTDAKSALDGAWKLEKDLWVKGKDSAVNKGTQYKIYNAGYFIWGVTYKDSLNKNHTDIGYGTFSLNGTEKLKETVAVSSVSDIRGAAFDIAIEMNGTDAFKQTITNTDSSKQVQYYTRLK